MMKERFVQSILDFEKENPDERNHTQRFLSLLEKYNDATPFFRDCFDDGHFTGSMLVINTKRTKILLMHHVKFGTWQQFGGHADGETNLRNVAIRELEEESGIQEKDADVSQEFFYLDCHKVNAYKGEPEHYHYDVGFIAVVDESIDIVREESEAHDIQWFDISQVKSQLDSGKYSSGLCRMLENI